MFKLKIKSNFSSCVNTTYFETLQEVAEHLKIVFNVETMSEFLKLQKELNFRIYLSYKKDM